MSAALREELDRVITRMQRIQRNISASRQPPSMLELEELPFEQQRKALYGVAADAAIA